MRSSLRTRLLLTFVALVVVVGGGTLIAIERTLADDLLASLDSRMTAQGAEVASWLAVEGHPDTLAPRLAAVTGARVTIVGPDGLIQGDSLEPATVGVPVGEASEVSRARRGQVGRATRHLRDDEPPQYLVAVPAGDHRVVRLAVPLGDVLATRARMRARLLVGAVAGFVGCLILWWFFLRAMTRPLQAMTRTAERLARGEYVAAPVASTGEVGVLARAMNRMTAEVKARVGELTEQRDLLSVVFAGLLEGVLVVDRARQIALINAAARPLIGDGALPPALLPLVERALEGEEGDAEVELLGRAVRASARPLGQEAPRAIVVLSDVTRLRALEAVRREFLSNAAHELRTPVTAISGYSETLLGGGVDDTTSREFLTTIHRNAQRIAALVADLLVLDELEGRAARVERREPVALAGVIDDAARTAKGVTPGAHIDIDAAPELAVLATRDGLAHVVQNLIDNAVKYGNNTPVSVRAHREGKVVQLAVADRGPGIPRGQEERIFERFYRLDAGRSRDRGGSGLGLAIVKRQIEAIGGRVWVEHGAPGARFVVELDAA